MTSCSCLHQKENAILAERWSLRWNENFQEILESSEVRNERNFNKSFWGITMQKKYSYNKGGHSLQHAWHCVQVLYTEMEHLLSLSSVYSNKSVYAHRHADPQITILQKVKQFQSMKICKHA